MTFRKAFNLLIDDKMKAFFYFLFFLLVVGLIGILWFATIHRILDYLLIGCG